LTGTCDLHQSVPAFNRFPFQNTNEFGLEVPDQPGLGIEFDPEEAEKHDRNPMPDHNFLSTDFKETYRSKDFAGD